MQTDFTAIAELRKLVKPLEMGVKLRRVYVRIQSLGSAIWVVEEETDKATESWVGFRRETWWRLADE